MEGPYSKGESNFIKKEIMILTVIACLITAILAGATVWSLNGETTWTTHWSNEYQSGDVIHTWKPDPELQAILAFSTIIMLFASIGLIARWLIWIIEEKVKKV